MLARFGGNLAAQTFGLALSFADRFLVVGLLLRTMGATGYSDWALLLSSAGLLAMAELGLNIYYGNEWQSAYAQGQEARFQRTLDVALFCSGALGLVLIFGALAVVASVDLAARLSLTTLSPRQADLVFLLLAAAVISRLVRGSISQIYRGRQAFARGVLIDMAFPASMVVALSTAAMVSGTQLVLAAAYLACDLIAGWGVMLIDLRRKFPQLRFHPRRPQRAEVLDLVRHVRWLALQQGAPVAWLQVPVLLLGWLGISGPALVSFLILRTLANFARQLASMFALSGGVELAHSFHRGDHDEFLRRLSIFGSSLSGVTSAVAMAIVVFGEPVVGLWTGQPALFDRSVNAWLIAALLISAPITPVATAMMFCKLPRPAALASLAQIGVGIVAVALLARWWGAPGAAAGLATGEAIGFGLVLPYLAAGPLRLDYWRYLARCVTTMAICGAWSGIVGFAIETAAHPSSFIRLFTAAVAWGLLGLAPALYVTLPSAQKATLTQAARRFHGFFSAI